MPPTSPDLIVECKALIENFEIYPDRCIWKRLLERGYKVDLLAVISVIVFYIYKV